MPDNVAVRAEALAKRTKQQREREMRCHTRRTISSLSSICMHPHPHMSLVCVQ